MSDHGIEVVTTATVHLLLDMRRKVKVREWEGDVTTDLGGEVSVKTKSLQMDTEDLRKTNNTHLFKAILKAERGERER